LLTADLVHARRQGTELKLVLMTNERRARALEIASELETIARAHVGCTREELEEAWSAIMVPAKDRKLADGLRKLIEDGLELEAGEGDPVALRREVFERAARERRERCFDRERLVSEIAAARGIDVERELYADLRSAHVLRAVNALPARAIVESYDVEQARAVLLRATKVVVRVESAPAGALRTLFRKLKFLRLLYRIERDTSGLTIELDGPYSMFESVTKYGLSLALALHAIAECGRWALAADVRWGPERRALMFKLSGETRPSDEVPDRLPDEVEAVRARFEENERWTVAIADDLLDLPGVGLCVPDLAFTHRETGEMVYLEVLGFWSRAAVWKRVELAEAGLPQKIVFAVSSRLRVSEEVLDDDVPAALYVYKGSIVPRALEEKLELVRAKTSKPRAPRSRRGK
jgi:predicted nuclease of restriction endonuclease-like RecB superfamily